MARDRKFTDEDIVDAAIALERSGKAINGTSLRNQIGMGRPDTLLAAYERLVEAGTISSSAQLVAATAVKAMPAEIIQMKHQIIDNIEKMFTNINAAAHEVVERQYIDWVKGAQDRAEQLEQKMLEATQQMEAAFNEAEDLSDENEKLTKQVEQLTQQLEVSQTSLTKATEENEALNQWKVEGEIKIRELDDHILDLHERLNQSQQTAAVESNKAAERLDLLNSANVKNDTLNAQLTETTAELAKLRSELNIASDHIDQKDLKLVELNDKLGSAAKMLDALEGDLKTSTALTTKHEQRAEVAEQRSHDLEQSMAKLEARIETLMTSEKNLITKASEAEGQAQVLKDNLAEAKNTAERTIAEHLQTIESLQRQLPDPE